VPLSGVRVRSEVALLAEVLKPCDRIKLEATLLDKQRRGSIMVDFDDAVSSAVCTGKGQPSLYL
jgi:hypothetical protein